MMISAANADAVFSHHGTEIVTVVEDTWVPAKEAETPGELTPQADDVEVPEPTIFEKVGALSPVDFGRLSAKDRDVALFVMLRTQAGQLQLLTDKVAEYERKGAELMSPEGMNELTSKFLGGMGGGLMKGLF
jgi:hypothetical protein